MSDWFLDSTDADEEPRPPREPIEGQLSLDPEPDDDRYDPSTADIPY